jgi:hypothetical protein
MTCTFVRSEYYIYFSSLILHYDALRLLCEQNILMGCHSLEAEVCLQRTAQLALSRTF